jgi:23S rRNA pseudouridine2605 synthase
MQGERIQKVLANMGLGSRRQVELWIEQQRIKVDGQLASLGQRITGAESITVDDREFRLKVATQEKVLIYNKPAGEICSQRDPEGRPTVFDRLPKLHKARWVAVGRLDINTSGLLLLTTDGQLANRLMHPRYGVIRTYAVRVLGEVDAAMLARLRQGVMLEDGMAAFTEVGVSGGQGANRWYSASLCEGRQREVRRLWESQGVTVSRLIRIRYGDIYLPKDLRAGHYRELTETEMAALQQQSLQAQ